MGLRLIKVIIALSLLITLGSLSFTNASDSLAELEISLTPQSVAMGLDETASVQVKIVVIHSNCPIEIDDTIIELPDVIELVGETDWLDVGADTFLKDITFKAVTEGTGELSVIRDCPRFGLLEKSIPIYVGVEEIPVVPDSPEFSWDAIRDLRLSEIADAYGLSLGELVSSLGLEGSEDLTAREIKRDYGLSNSYMLVTIEELYLENNPQVEDDVGVRIDLNLYQKDYALLALMVVSLLLFFYKKYKMRYVTLALALLYFGFYERGCMCHVGAIGNLLMRDMYVIRLHWIVLVLVPVATSILFGRVFCGWVCFFGTVQQFIYDLRKRIFPRMKPINPPRALHLFKFLVLFAVAYYAMALSRQIICEYDPFFNIFNRTFSWSFLGILTLVLVMTSFLIERPFCRYVCPLGAILWVTEKVPLYRVRVGASCNSCSLCNKVCPMNKDIPNDGGECICCGECLEKCKKGSLEYKLK